MTPSHFLSISPQDQFLARFPWPVATGLSIVVLLGGSVQSFQAAVADSLFLVPANLSFVHFWPLWTGHFVQPESFALAIFGSVTAFLLAVELESRWGSINLGKLCLFICPVISLSWVGIEIGADQLGLLSATRIPLTSHPLVTFLVAARMMASSAHYLLASGYRVKVWFVSAIYGFVLMGTLIDAGTWAIFLPAHLVAWGIATILVAVIQRRETTLLQHVRKASQFQPLPDVSKPDPKEEDWQDRLDHVLSAVAVHGLDGLSWDDWRFLRATSRRLRRS
jgi:hypothetical protein